MRTFHCVCGGDLFFHSSGCTRCGRTVGLCPHCLNVAAVEPTGEGRFRCVHEGCGGTVVACRHQTDGAWCNRYVAIDDDAPMFDSPPMCGDCRTTTHLPDLTAGDNLDKVRELEFAKQRVLMTLRRMGLPWGGRDDDLPLTFRFLADVDGEHYATGHADGVVTINLEEADPVRREENRVKFHEPQRTLVGHLRHEIGHYYWQRLVSPDEESLASYRRAFGDERDPSYADAMQAYYDNGPAANWREDHVSAYATMHSWEDFAETFNAYLDMRAVLDTAAHFGVRANMLAAVDAADDFDRMIRDYMIVGVVANELNRDLGLPDLVPEVFTAAVREKLRWVHEMAAAAARPPGAEESAAVNLAGVAG